MTDEKKYWIDIETAEGELVTDAHADVHDETYGIEVDLPEGVVVDESGEVVKSSSETTTLAAPMLKKHMGIKAKRTIANTIIYIVLAIMVIVWLFPFFGIICESFRCDLRVGGEPLTAKGDLVRIKDGILRQGEKNKVEFVINGQNSDPSDDIVITGLTRKDYKKDKEGNLTVNDTMFVKKEGDYVFLTKDGELIEKVSRVTNQVGYIFPQRWGFDNFINLFTNKNIQFGKWFLNTFIMGVVVCITQTVIVLSMSYTLSRLRFKGRKSLMNGMLVLGMFPGFLTLILLYKLLSDFGLTGANSIWGLILVYVASSGMGYYVSKGFFDTIPKSLDEAARVDGANRFQVFYKIILPMAKPIVIYTILMGFMAPWGDFVMAKYIAHNTNAGFNVAVGLQWMISTPTNLTQFYTSFCAGGVVVAVPITALFLFLQKYYVEGVTGGAVKG